MMRATFYIIFLCFGKLRNETKESIAMKPLATVGWIAEFLPENCKARLFRQIMLKAKAYPLIRDI